MNNKITCIVQKSKTYTLLYASMWRTLKEEYTGKIVKHNKLGNLTLLSFSFHDTPRIYCTDEVGNRGEYIADGFDDIKLKKVLSYINDMIKIFNEYNEILRNFCNTNRVVFYNSEKYFIKHFYVLDDKVALLRTEYNTTALPDSKIVYLNKIKFHED